MEVYSDRNKPPTAYEENLANHTATICKMISNITESEGLVEQVKIKEALNKIIESALNLAEFYCFDVEEMEKANETGEVDE